MKPRISLACITLLALAGTAAPTWAADKPDIGKREYQSNCVACLDSVFQSIRQP